MCTLILQLKGLLYLVPTTLSISEIFMSLLLTIFQAVVTQMHVPIGFVNKGMTSYCNICFSSNSQGVNLKEFKSWLM